MVHQVGINLTWSKNPEEKKKKNERCQQNDKALFLWESLHVSIVNQKRIQEGHAKSNFKVSKIMSYFKTVLI